jgi:hypothetical protein
MTIRLFTWASTFGRAARAAVHVFSVAVCYSSVANCFSELMALLL